MLGAADGPLLRRGRVVEVAELQDRLEQVPVERLLALVGPGEGVADEEFVLVHPAIFAQDSKGSERWPRLDG